MIHATTITCDLLFKRTTMKHISHPDIHRKDGVLTRPPAKRLQSLSFTKLRFPFHIVCHFVHQFS